MQFMILLVAFWMPVLLALKAGVSAAPIPTRAPRGLETRNIEFNFEERAEANSEPIVAYRREEVEHVPVRRQSRAVRRAVGSQEHKRRATSATSKLFPVAGAVKSWSTSSSAGGTGSRKALTLSNAIFRAQHDMSNNPHPIVAAPDGKMAMQASYAKGTYTYSHGSPSGFSLYAPGPADVDISTAKEATFGYSIYFPEGFDFVKGGKLPGIYGGDSDAEAVGCSGGRRDNGCFSARFMFRAEGAGELYTYLPPGFDANKKVCDVKPYSECNPTYGASVGRGSFKFATGAWTTITERVKLNDADEENGELEMFANGESVVKVTGLKLRDSDKGRMRGLQMQTFFGGSKPDFANTKDQKVYFTDFSVAITESL